MTPALTLNEKVPQKAAVPPQGPFPKSESCRAGPALGPQRCFPSSITPVLSSVPSQQVLPRDGRSCGHTDTPGDAQGHRAQQERSQGLEIPALALKSSSEVLNCPPAPEGHKPPHPKAEIHPSPFSRAAPRG